MPIVSVNFEAKRNFCEAQRLALDGSKVKANADKHKAISYGRMEETNRWLRKEVQELLKKAEAADEE